MKKSVALKKFFQERRNPLRISNFLLVNFRDYVLHAQGRLGIGIYRHERFLSADGRLNDRILVDASDILDFVVQELGDYADDSFGNPLALRIGMDPVHKQLYAHLAVDILGGYYLYEPT